MLVDGKPSLLVLGEIENVLAIREATIRGDYAGAVALAMPYLALLAGRVLDEDGRLVVESAHLVRQALPRVQPAEADVERVIARDEAHGGSPGGEQSPSSRSRASTPSQRHPRNQGPSSPLTSPQPTGW